MEFITKSIRIGVLSIVIGLPLIGNEAIADPTGVASAVMRPEVIVLTAFPLEWHAWTKQKSYHFKTINFPGQYRPLICDEHGVCVTETGEGEMNAAITVTSIVKDHDLNVSKTIFIRSGIAGGVDSKGSALGSVYINNWIISWAFGHHYLNDQKTLAWAPPGCGNYAHPGDCADYTQNTQENLAYKINPQILSMAVRASAGTKLLNTPGAKKLDNTFSISTQPKIMVGATITGDDFWIGRENQSIAEKIVHLYTHGKAAYTNTAMEDLGDIAALYRFGLENHYLSIRGISDIDIPPPGKTEEQIWKTGDLYASELAEKTPSW
ncbi:phosphorylase [Acidithiobacillus sp. M4-SHS-6]|uniref:phosphorylase n=1 Tax=Acidithiobacillus sp. M4-SHS-6 TaxID=3383024 RepID=UPI0039BEA612